MTVLIKKLSFLFIVLYTSTNYLQSQKIISINLCDVDEDNAMWLGDSIMVTVHVSVDDTSVVDDNTLTGDLYYWYQTDTMLAAGMPPGYINVSTAIETIPPGGKLETLHIHFQPHEVHTGPVNVICLWASMQLPSVVDSVPCCNTFILVQPVGINESEKITYNVVYPNPTEQQLFIKQEEIKLIEKINVFSVEGKSVQTYSQNQFVNGILNLEELETGYYLIELLYKNDSVNRSKIFKR